MDLELGKTGGKSPCGPVMGGDAAPKVFREAPIKSGCAERILLLPKLLGLGWIQSQSVV